MVKLNVEDLNDPSGNCIQKVRNGSLSKRTARVADMSAIRESKDPMHDVPF